jgi:hypothetical protein
MKKLVIILPILIILLYSWTISAENSPPLPELFIEQIEELAKFLQNQGISLREGENIKDVAAFTYLNAIKSLDRSFGELDDQVKEEAKNWAKLLCWLPTIPEDKKKKAAEKIQKVRARLVGGAYERTLASLTIVPNFAAVSVGEIVQPERLFSMYPSFGESMTVFKVMRENPTSGRLASDISADKFDYSDIINYDWVNQYLK